MAEEGSKTPAPPPMAKEGSKTPPPPPSLTPIFPLPDSDIDLSFTSTTSSSTTTTTFSTSSFSSSSCSARSSLSLLPFNTHQSSSSIPSHPLPHHASDPHWSAVRTASSAAAATTGASLHLRHLRLLRQLGSGNLARVFHCRLLLHDDDDDDDNNSSPDFALKVIDVDALRRNAKTNSGDKLAHVETEARVLASLDHPFLPTLYARIDAPPRYVCFLIDYCPGGDLHSLLRRRRRLPLPSATFYAAEVLLALEYLHASGFVYRDLKPENVLLRADGHVMLSDFDLCLPAPVVPTLHRYRRRRSRTKKKNRNRYGCCFARGSHSESESESESEEETEFVAEPEAASSRECVGTHEYLAPEVAAGGAHGNGVDWWAFGVLLYELLYGRTPFKGESKEATLRNIKTRPLLFPDGDDAAAAARDLIEKLLVRDPQRRMGSVKGAAEVKRHPFFDGVDWPLIRRYPAAAVVAGGGGVWLRRGWFSKGLSRRGSVVGGGGKDNVLSGKGLGVVNLELRSKSQKSMNGWFD